MDFDSIVSLLILILFFVLPTLAKQLKEKKKLSSTDQQQSEDLGQQIGDFLKAIGQQKDQEEDEPAQEPDDIWARLAGEEESDQDDYDQEDDYHDEEYDVPDLPYWENAVEPEEAIEEHVPPPVVEEPVVEPEPVMVSRPAPKVSDPEPDLAATGDFSTAGRFRGNPLQNAVIWSEILGKPVALRNE